VHYVQLPQQRVVLKVVINHRLWQKVKDFLSAQRLLYSEGGLCRMGHLFASHLMALSIAEIVIGER
jgi:hypothetical protein